MLPYLRRRPISIVRCPNGPGAACFFRSTQPRARFPIETTLITESGGRRPYIVANTVEALVGLAQMNALELHAWGAMAGAIERPDTLVLDLDPDPGLEVVQSRRRGQVDARAGELGLESLVKTTGGKGLHVVVPLQARHSWDEVRSFAQSIADHLARTLPEQFTATMAKARRRGKNLRRLPAQRPRCNRSCALLTACAPGATVATPLAWEELTPRLKPAAFNLASVLRRAEREKDPWAGYDKLRQRLTAPMRRALKA
jgi:bifunctional non-homologous end joining protein LigD